MACRDGTPTSLLKAVHPFVGFRLSGCYEIQQGVIVKKVKNLPGRAGLI